MNILHLSPYFPSLDTNHAGGIFMGKQIETLKKKHNVYILTFIASDFDRSLASKVGVNNHYHFVRIMPWSKALHILFEPLLPNYFAARSSLRFTVKLLWCIMHYHIDAIQAEYASMGQYLWIKKLFPEIKFNLTEHDVTAQSYERKIEKAEGLKRRYYQYQLRKVLKAEERYCRKADLVFALNEKDKVLLQQYYGLEKCQVINPYYGVEDTAVLMENEEKNGAEYANICFMGQMGREENIVAAMRLISIGKRVKKHIPQLQIYIVGNNPSQALKKQENNYIHITGFVDDVDVYLKKAQAAVFPLTMGAGIKFKVLRSLALGTPVITSKIGAEGIDEQGEVIVLAETDEEYVRCIIELINNVEECCGRSVNCKQFIADNFCWEKSEEILERVYKEGE